MHKITNWTIAAITAAMLASSSTASDAKKLHLVDAPSSSTKPQPQQGQPVHYNWSEGAAPQAHKDLVATFGKVGLGPGQYVWAGKVASGDTRVIVDLVTQMMYVYRGDELLGASSMSSAKTGHVTPYGHWTILEKRPFYRSKKYDNAPMPWMERIDEYGIAFHGGLNPGYPASHGCMRLPVKFAEKVYGVTKVGTKVVIEG